MRILKDMTERPKNMPLNPKYVICYSPGKVGSTSVMEALRTINIPCHRCEDHNIEQYHKRNWPTISPVREPISWVFSHIFESFMPSGTYPRPEDAPAFVEAIQNGRWNADLMRYNSWWARQFRQTTGVSVFTQRWKKRQGWTIISLRALIVRTDKLNDILEPALNKFIPQYYPDVDMSTLDVQHRAKGADRFERYEEFMDNVRFNPYWLAKFYDNSEMANHFFFRKELKAWVKKWAKI